MPLLPSKKLLWASVVCLPFLSGFPVPASAVSTPEIQAGFSPEGSARALVLDTLHSATQSIRMMAYTFTDPDVMKALSAAHRRGVDVKIVVDGKGNRGKSSQAALDLMVNSGIAVRTSRHFALQHDKAIIVDGRTVETGSYNYTRSAGNKNSENVVVIKNAPAVAGQYLKHWQSRWDRGTDWRSSY